MTVIGFEEDEVVRVFQLVAAVLKLGNVQFVHHNNIDGTDGARISHEDGAWGGAGLGRGGAGRASATRTVCGAGAGRDGTGWGEVGWMRWGVTGRDGWGGTGWGEDQPREWQQRR